MLNILWWREKEFLWNIRSSVIVTVCFWHKNIWHKNICFTRHPGKLLEHRQEKAIPNYKVLINPLLAVALLGHVCTELSYRNRNSLKTFLQLLDDQHRLKSCYDSVRIHRDFQKYLRFCYKGTLYNYTVFPSGLCICSKRFPKIIKPPSVKFEIKCR